MSFFAESLKLLKYNCEFLLNEEGAANAHRQMTGSFLGRLIYPIASHLSIQPLMFIKKFLEKTGCVSGVAWIELERQRRVCIARKQTYTGQIQECDENIAGLVLKVKDNLLQSNSNLNSTNKIHALGLKVEEIQQGNSEIVFMILRDDNFIRELRSKLFGDNAKQGDVNKFDEALRVLCDKNAIPSKGLLAYVLTKPERCSDQFVALVKDWLLQNGKQIVAEDNDDFMINNRMISVLKETDLDREIRNVLIKAQGVIKEQNKNTKKIAVLMIKFNELVNSLNESAAISSAQQKQLAEIFEESLKLYDSFPEVIKKSFEIVFDRLNAFTTQTVYDVLNPDLQRFQGAYNSVANKLNRDKLQIEMNTNLDEHLLKQLQAEDDAALATKLQSEIHFE